jgi:hypothetical protein
MSRIRTKKGSISLSAFDGKSPLGPLIFEILAAAQPQDLPELPAVPKLLSWYRLKPIADIPTHYLVSNG